MIIHMFVQTTEQLVCHTASSVCKLPVLAHFEDHMAGRIDDCDVHNVILKAFDSQCMQRPCLLLVHKPCLLLVHYLCYLYLDPALSYKWHGNCAP